MIKEIKLTDTIGNMRVFINENFKELDERLKMVEKKLVIKKTKKK